MRQTIVCPHCRSKKAMYKQGAAEVSDEAGYLLFLCENCNKPTVLSVEAVNPKPELETFFYFTCRATQIEKSGWRICESWPEHNYRESMLPEGVPGHIQSHFQHSQDAAANRGYDLAIQGFQRALLMTKEAHSPGFKGTLRAWILSLVATGQLLKNVKEWLTRISLQAEVHGASALQAEEFATFTFVILDQLYGVNSQIRAYRGGGAT